MPSAKYFALDGPKDMGRLPAIGFGTFSPTSVSIQDIKTHVLYGLRNGYRHIDTAFMYGNGDAEEAVGLAISEWEGQRKDVWITTKLANCHHSPNDVVEAARFSTRNLDTDYLDLYLMHFPIAYVRQGESGTARHANGKPKIDFEQSRDYVSTWRAMEDLVFAGKVKYIGVSNFSAVKLRKLLRKARIKPSVNQIELHPYLPQRKMLDFCHSHGIHVMAHSPLGGKPVAQVAPNAHLPGPMVDPTISQIAVKHKASIATVLLAWALRRGTSVVPKSFNPTNISNNLTELQRFHLDEVDFAAIEALRSDDDETRFNDPIHHWGFDIYNESKDEPAEEDVESIKRRMGVAS